jgi:Lon protease-like protein
MSESSGLPADFDNQVPLFPLPDLVAFPSNVLPLHIFESRYREMMADVIQGNQLIAMATLVPGYHHEYYSRPPIAPPVCIGRVIAHEETDKGTFNLMLAGVSRAEVKAEIEPVRAYRRATVELLREHGVEEATSRLVERLTSLIRDSFPSGERLIAGLLREKTGISTLTDVLAFHLPLAVDVKLRLLSEPNVAARAKQLIDSWPLESQNSQRSNFPTDFSEN